MKVFFDASVLIAALLSPSGGSAQLLKYIKSETITGITSQTALAEVSDKTEKIQKSQTEIEQFIAESHLLVRKHLTLDEIAPYQNLIDIGDAHLIAGAYLTKCTHLVTLDKKHLLRSDIQAKFLPLKILNPKELLEELVLQP